MDDKNARFYHIDFVSDDPKLQRAIDEIRAAGPEISLTKLAAALAQAKDSDRITVRIEAVGVRDVIMMIVSRISRAARHFDTRSVSRMYPFSGGSQLFGDSLGLGLSSQSRPQTPRGPGMFDAEAEAITARFARILDQIDYPVDPPRWPGGHDLIMGQTSQGKADHFLTPEERNPLVSQDQTDQPGPRPGETKQG